MDTGRLLQCLNYMREQAAFYFLPVCPIFTFADEQISDHAFAVFVNEKGIAEYPSARNCRVAWKKLRIRVAENHFRRAAVVPAQQLRPDFYLVLEQRAQVGRRKVSEVENLHRAPENTAARLAAITEFSGAHHGRQTPRTLTNNTNGNSRRFLWRNEILACGNIEELQLLGIETSKKYCLPSCSLADVVQEPVRSHHQVLLVRNLAKFVARNNLVAIKLQSKFRLARRPKNCRWQMMGIELRERAGQRSS